MPAGPVPCHVMQKANGYKKGERCMKEVTPGEEVNRAGEPCGETEYIRSTVERIESTCNYTDPPASYTVVVHVTER